jgi:hypothetical protein
MGFWYISDTLPEFQERVCCGETGTGVRRAGDVGGVEESSEGCFFAGAYVIMAGTGVGG